MRPWVILLGVAAGLGPVAEEAFADRGRRGHSSAQQHRHLQHQARQQHHQHRQHARPQHHQHRQHARPHRHHWRSPAIVVAPAFGAGHFYSPGYYYAPAPVIQAPPVVAAPPAVHPSNTDGYWYFCPDSRAYYPYVLECPSPWMRVVPN